MFPFCLSLLFWFRRWSTSQSSTSKNSGCFYSVGNYNIDLRVIKNRIAADLDWITLCMPYIYMLNMRSPRLVWSWHSGPIFENSLLIYWKARNAVTPARGQRCSWGAVVFVCCLSAPIDDMSLTNICVNANFDRQRIVHCRYAACRGFIKQNNRIWASTVQRWFTARSWRPI